VTLAVTARKEGQAEPVYETDDELYEVGSGVIVPELDEHVRGAKVGDILDFAAQAGDDELSFRVMVKDVKEKVLPDVTDEWASEASEFETVAELEADIRNRISVVKRVQAQMALRNEALNALVELVGEEAPEPLVAQEMERRLHDLAHRLEAQGATIAQYLEATGTSQEQLVEGLRGDAVGAVKADLALRALAEAEGLEAAEAEVDAEIARLAERLEESPETVRRRLDQQDALPTVRSDLRKSKALEWLVDHVEVVDEEGQPVDRGELAPPPAPQEEGEGTEA
jgi:trigger factor